MVLHAGSDAEDEVMQNEVKKALSKPVSKPVREPARQVPVETHNVPDKFLTGQEAEKPSAEEGGSKPAEPPQEKQGQTSSDPSVEEAADPARPSPTAKAKEEKPVKGVEKTDEGDVQAKEVEMAVPGPPIRKPRKPVIRKKEKKKAGKHPAPRGSARQKLLCKALQKCRNDFIKCKSKIKHPDQSEPWIIAKEVCGSHYKVCVEKDFRPGEWFMTRWFYFQELNCGE